MSWLGAIPEKPVKPMFEVREYKPINSGRRGTPILFEGVEYRNFADASRKTGLTKAAIRWKLFQK